MLCECVPVCRCTCVHICTGMHMRRRSGGFFVLFFFLGNGMPAPRLPVLPHAHSHPQPHPYHQWGHPAPHCRCLPVNPCTAWEREKCRLAIMEDAPGQMVPRELGTWVLVLSACDQWGQWQVLGQNYVCYLFLFPLVTTAPSIKEDSRKVVCSFCAHLWV